MFYFPFYEILYNLFEGAPSWVNDYVIPIFIVIIFIGTILGVIFMFSKLIKGVIPNKDTLEEEEEKKPYRRNKLK